MAAICPITHTGHTVYHSPLPYFVRIGRFGVNSANIDTWCCMILCGTQHNALVSSKGPIRCTIANFFAQLQVLTLRYFALARLDLATTNKVRVLVSRFVGNILGNIRKYSESFGGFPCLTPRAAHARSACSKPGIG